MKKGFTFLIISLLISFVFCLPKNGLAQEINDYSSDFSIELVPDNPRPNQAVSAKIVSYQFDINRSDITWILNFQNEKIFRQRHRFSLASQHFCSGRI